MERMKTETKQIARAIWCHRVMYAGLAAAYGAGCMGWIGKDVVQQIVTAVYVALVVKG